MTPMLFDNLTINSISSRFDKLTTELIKSERIQELSDPDHSPAALRETMFRLIDILQLVDQQTENESENALSEDELNELGDYGINLLMDFSALAMQLELNEESREIEDLALPLALWLGRHLGQIKTLEPIVNALARLANTYQDNAELEQLYEVVQELLNTVSPELKTRKKQESTSESWRILLINQAIIATRSHRPGLIERAYEILVEYIPEEAPAFFKEGMSQMEALNYPQQVREVVEKYYNLWSSPRTLH
ncbi:MAG: hypothetical protein N0E59_13625 [Candidatus Thiodiazotropha taylori]|nr:hypothetical protein [Candidatus Thiodiazotropha taylori]MCG8111794.1 hypothetical protein [Candidatus Thiodiazotropha taylori]MCW4279823.1 hypothetical protein [Candidatus Thiodiazotropha taylori]MCW4284150.1 hypothetical protein [Candidatus Thiodiazotropha taylori]MCW4302973.1 hypothetical protein [Candidatus Thiodiazotropha taylori]